MSRPAAATDPVPPAPASGGVCPVCNLELGSEPRVCTREGATLHAVCFVCTTCQCALTAASYGVDLNGRLYCPCHLRSARRPEADYTTLARGWLRKQGGVVPTWRRRFFVLALGSRELCYYDAPGARRRKGAIDLAAVTAVQPAYLYVPRDRADPAAPSGSLPAFQLLTPARVWNIACDTEADRSAWIRAIETARAAAACSSPAASRGVGRAAPPSPPLSAAADDGDTPAAGTSTRTSTSSTGSSAEPASPVRAAPPPWQAHVPRELRSPGGSSSGNSSSSSASASSSTASTPRTPASAAPGTADGARRDCACVLSASRFRAASVGALSKPPLRLPPCAAAAPAAEPPPAARIPLCSASARASPRKGAGAPPLALPRTASRPALVVLGAPGSPADTAGSAAAAALDPALVHSTGSLPPIALEASSASGLFDQ